MLSSAWQSLTGRKHSREEKEKVDDEKTIPMRPLGGSAGGSGEVRVSPRQRRKSSAPQPDPVAPSPSVVEPSSANPSIVIHPPVPSYDQPPSSAHLPLSPLQHPPHAPPSYADSVAQPHHQSQAQLYPVASLASSSPASSSSMPSQYVAAPVQRVGEEKRAEEEKVAHAGAAAIPMTVAVPVMVAPSRMSQRLMDQAARSWVALQASPHFQAGQAKVIALADKHVPPEIRDFIRAPTIGKALRHPTYVFFIYQLYRSVRAPFVGLFKVILLNAARRALGRSVTKDPSAAGKLNDELNAGLRDAIGHDFNVALSPAVCQRIVENIDTEDLKKLFGWFSTTKVK